MMCDTMASAVTSFMKSGRDWLPFRTRPGQWLG